MISTELGASTLVEETLKEGVVEIIRATQEKQITAISNIIDAFISLVVDNRELNNINDFNEVALQRDSKTTALYATREDLNIYEVAKKQSELIKGLILAFTQMLEDNTHLDEYGSIGGHLKQQNAELPLEATSENILEVEIKQSEAMYALVDSIQNLSDAVLSTSFIAKDWTKKAMNLILETQTALNLSTN